MPVRPYLTGSVGISMIVAVAAFPQGLSAQAPAMADDPVAIFNAAMADFARGEWLKSITGLERALATVTDPNQKPKLGPVYFTLAAAYFNASNFNTASDKFSYYLQNYPNGDKVLDAKLGLARSAFLGKNYEQAVKIFAQLEAIPALRDMSLGAQAACYKELGDEDNQVRVLEKIIAPEIRTRAQAAGGVTLAEIYITKDLSDKALGLVNQLQARVGLVDNVVALNSVTVKLGDDLATKKQWMQALAAYRVVRSRDEVIEFQRARLAAMAKLIAANTERARADAQLFMAVNATNKLIEGEVQQATKLLEAFEKLPDHGPGVLFRMAKVWYDQGKKWEAITVFDRFLHVYPAATEAEPALHSMIVCYGDLGRIERTQTLCERYLKDFPAGPNAGTVGYMLGAVSLQANDPKKAATYFGMILEKQPESDYAQQLRMGLGHAHFMMGEFAEARKNYNLYLTKYPNGEFAEEAIYRNAITTLSLGEYEAAQAQTTAYLQKFPQGSFVADAGYRLLVCKYAASQFEEVVADAKSWQAKNPGHEISGEVFALTGDSLAALNRSAEAAAAYTEAYKIATTEEVFNYTLFEAGKQLQKLGKWPEVAKMFEDFVLDKPDHPTVVGAMYWIGRAKAREGKIEEAKTFLVTQLKRFINEPKREAVEQLLQQLVQLCSKRPRQAAPPVAAVPADPAVATDPAVAAGGTPPAVTPATAAVAAPGSAATSAGADPSAAGAVPPPPALPPPLPPYDALAELRKQLAPLEADANTTGRARLLYAEAELAKARKQPEEAERIYAGMAVRFKSDDLSPVMLALVGDYLLFKGEVEKAGTYFEAMREDYPKSDSLDFAYTGLGELAMARKDYKQALELFTHAADEIAALKIKEATMGKGRALLELGRYEDAKKVFAQVAGVREWRGDTTAQAVYCLGEVEWRQGHWAEAVAHYQRVFVAYQKYLPWVAKSYVRCAECFEKLGRRPEAVGHLQEMLRNPKLESFPEILQAKKMLAQWGVAA